MKKFKKGDKVKVRGGYNVEEAKVLGSFYIQSRERCLIRFKNKKLGLKWKNVNGYNLDLDFDAEDRGFIYIDSQYLELQGKLNRIIRNIRLFFSNIDKKITIKNKEAFSIFLVQLIIVLSMSVSLFADNYQKAIVYALLLIWTEIGRKN